jgi:DNA modification methylase
VKPGEMWGAGKSADGWRHRIICGDCTEPATVARLLGKETVDQLNTDPPYGVNLEKQDELYSYYGSPRSTSGEMLNDNIKDYRAFFAAFLTPIPFSKTNSVYIFMQRRRITELFQACADAGIYVSEDLVWVKSAPVFGRHDYHHQHEWIVYGWKGRHEFYRNSGTTLIDEAIDPESLDQASLLKIVKKLYETADIIREKKNAVNALHPTMKPVRLVQRLILDGTKRNAIVYDPFSGSGTVSDACENTGRRARAVEQDAKYVAVWCECMSEKLGAPAEKIE